MQKHKLALIILVIFGTSTLAKLFGGTVPISDQNFATGGSISGVLAVSNVQIGTSPWYGTNTGILGLLPPALTISSGSATIGGLLNASIVGINDNSGLIYQTLSSSFLPNSTYTFTANLTYSGALGASLLSDGSAGIEFLNSAGTVLESSATAGPLLSVTLLGGSSDQVTLQYTTGSSVPTGGIEIGLFASPNEALSTTLASQVAFSNVGLTVQAAPEPSASCLIVSGAVFLFAVTTLRRIRRRAS